MMQKALTQQRELTVYHAKEMEKDGQKKINLLRTEYESRIQRHQAFIDQVGETHVQYSVLCTLFNHNVLTNPKVVALPITPAIFLTQPSSFLLANLKE